MNTKMRAAQIGKAGGDWELVERDIREPGAGEVRVKVERAAFVIAMRWFRWCEISSSMSIQVNLRPNLRRDNSG